MRRRPTATLRGLLATLAAAALAVSLSLASTQLVLAAPVDPDFTVTPQSPLPGQAATFTATNLRGSDSVEWDFENDGSFDATGTTAQHAYATAGERTVLMRVRRSGREVVDVRKAVRVDAPPKASFTASPNPARVGETVQLNAAGSSDPDGTIASYAWDLDNDGQFDDAAGIAVSRSFAVSGSYTVRLRVTDSRGSADTAAATVTVSPAAGRPAPPPNRAPVAGFTYYPRQPLAGGGVQLLSTSSDPEGSIASHAWDLDDDGQFDDSFGRAPVARFATPGYYVISLRVTDAVGVADVESQAIAVGQRRASAVPAPEIMRPFPIVRIVGRSTGFGARIKLLVVRGAPRGAKVTVRCRGRRCRLRPRGKYVRFGSARFRSFERRVPAGVRIQVFVTQPGRIGKYTSFKIRRTRPPLREDLCVTSVRAKPRRCPMS